MLRLDPAASRRLPGLWAWSLRLDRDPAADAAGLPDARHALRPAWALDTLKDEPVAAAFRTLSWAAGVDPTKNRPSGEALARRLLRGADLPTIHPLVDAYNRASAATLVPIGAYDLDHVRLPLTVRPARQGEGFHGIGRDEEPLDAHRIVYADGRDTVCGVLMWRDAHATRIRDGTRHALLVSVGADPVPAMAGRDALAEAGRIVQRVGFRPDGAPRPAHPPT